MELTLSIIWNLFVVLLLVFLNGFFVAAEFAIVKVRATQLAQLTTERGRRAQQVVANLDNFLSATQLGITLASLGLGWVGEPTLARFIHPLFQYLGMPAWLLHPFSFVVAFLIITILHIVLGEVVPKSLAIRKAEQVTLWTATPLIGFYRLFLPFIYILNSVANKVIEWMGFDHQNTQQVHTEEEIRMLLSQSHKSGVFDQTEMMLLDNVFEFTDRVAREIMVPRVNIDCVYLDREFEENLMMIRESTHTRLPLCGQDKDDIRGIVHIRDVYERVISGDPFEIEDLVRPTVVVPETMELKDILLTLQKNKTGMAIVVDEYGGTSGLVTTEDIIEEIFGEIQDEFDEHQTPFFQKKGLQTSIDARLLIDDVNDYFQLSIDDPDNDTIGGWLFSQLEKVPDLGDHVHYMSYEFTVEEVDQLQIKRILVTHLPEEESNLMDEST
ncbi:Hemolysin, contains CBS domains [Seinonella peptonophila]|uniref:Hemolysin, contains CBS domains n=1 Tax=Seinonella peptonophila TaxID=112248 RepID=A0A1M4T052_9BACL|nr:hemolysin family protein [Seinonella peptonophila]SHE37839.1 Hemolysin, contains CBS domains [Seinonella peptonophila]